MIIKEQGPNSYLIKIISAAGGILLGFLLVRIFLTPYQMPDGSMEPNIKKGETIFILKHTTPKSGDVALIESPVESGRYIIRRVAAIEGDTVEIKDKVFRINGAVANFKWKTRSADKRAFPMNFTFRDNMPAVKVSRNHYFVISDDLDRGYDSRVLGPVPDNLVAGTLLYKY